MHPAAEAETTTAPRGPSKPAPAGPRRRRSSRLASKTDAEETMTAPRGPSKPAAAGPARRRSSGLASKTDAEETTTAPRRPSKPAEAGSTRQRSSRLASKTDAEETTTAPRGPSKPVAAGPARRRSSRLASKTDAEETMTAPRGPSKPAAAGPTRRRSSRLAAASSKTTTPLSADTEEPVLQLPRSLRKEVGPALRAAAAIEPLRPRVAYLCRLYASERADRKDQDSAGPGVPHFKTALSKRLEKDNVPSLAQRLKKSDALEVESFCYQNYIRALDKADRAECDKAYQTSRVLFEVLNFLNNDDPKITRAHKDVQEKVDTYRQLNSLPLDAALTIRKPEEEARGGFKKTADAVRENGGTVLSGLGLRPPAPTVITDIPGDLLREIFLLLPSLPSLIRAALACRTFLHAVRSCPTFRPRFQGLHPPQILGFFSFEGRGFPTFTPLRSCSDPDLAAVVRGSDFFLTRLPQDIGDSDSGWVTLNCHGGCFVLVNQTTDQIAAYNPLTQSLHIFPMPAQEIRFCHIPFEVHIIIPEEDQGVVRMVFVQHLKLVPICVAVFSSATWVWQHVRTLPYFEDDGAPPALRDFEDDEEKGLSSYIGTQVNGFIYWKHATEAHALALNTATLQLFRMDLPEFMEEIDSKLFGLCQTTDGKLCVVGADIPDPCYGTLISWVWRTGDDGVEEWVQEGFFPLHTIIDDSEDIARGYVEAVYVEAVVDGFVYLSCNKSERQPGYLLSLCLETREVKRLFDGTYTSHSHPYIMMWPRSLGCNKASPCLKIPATDTH